MRLPRLLPAVLLLLPLTACAIPTTGIAKAGAPAIARPADGIVRLYFLGPHGTAVVSRPTHTPLTPQAALDLLLKGPTQPEQRIRGLTTRLPKMNGKIIAKTTTNTVDVHLPPTTTPLQPAAISQITCTAAHANIPGHHPPTRIDIRIHTKNGQPRQNRTLRCDNTGNAIPHQS